MHEITTYVDINAGAATVWDILTDFSSYRRWNPLFPRVLGSAERGNVLTLTQRRGAVRSGRESLVIRTVKHVREPREMFWIGSRLHALWYASERRFRIEHLGEYRVRLHQVERLSGVGGVLVWFGLHQRVFADLGSMNRALKIRAELAEASFADKRRQRQAAA